MLRVKTVDGEDYGCRERMEGCQLTLPVGCSCRPCTMSQNEEAKESLCSVRVGIDVRFSDTQNAILKGQDQDEFVENCRLLIWMKARQS